MSFGDLRSLLHGNSDIVTASEFMGFVYDAFRYNPVGFIDNYSAYIEDYLANSDNGKGYRKDNLVIRITEHKKDEILNTSLYFGLLVDDEDVDCKFKLGSFKIYQDYFINPVGVSVNVSTSDYRVIDGVMRRGGVNHLQISNSVVGLSGLNSHLYENQITSIDLHNVENLDLDEILSGLQGLERLRISNSYVGDRGAGEISQTTLGCLRELELVGCRIGDEGIISLVNQFNGNLRSLESICFFNNNFRYFEGGGAALIQSRLGRQYDVDTYIEMNSW